jgi:ribosomal protein L40E
MKKLAAKLLDVMHECSYVQKNGKNQFHGYKYATSADVLEKVNQSFVKHGIISLAKPELFDLTDVTTLKGNIEKLATIQMTITLMDVETGETFEIIGIGSGQDAGDKAVMKAETAAIKYAYMLTLNISTGDDPEADSKTDEHTLASTGGQTSCATMQNEVKRPPQVGRKAVNTLGKVHVCSDCGARISDKVAAYSKQQFGRELCMRCQHEARESA